MAAVCMKQPSGNMYLRFSRNCTVIL